MSSRLAPFFGCTEVAPDSQSTLFKARDGCGREIALRVFERNSGWPPDIEAVSSAIHLRHPHLQRVHGVGAFADGTQYVAARWLDRGPTGESGRPEMSSVRRAAFQLASALSFLHSQGLCHGSISNETIVEIEEGFVLTRMEGLHRMRGWQDASEDRAALGRCLLNMATGRAFADATSEKREERAIGAVRDAGLRRLITRLTAQPPMAFTRTDDAFLASLDFVSDFDDAEARSCIGVRVRQSARLTSAIGASREELRRGRAASLFVHGGWGSGCRDHVMDALDRLGPSLLALRAKDHHLSTSSALDRIEAALADACDGLGESGDSPTQGQSGSRIARLAARLLGDSGRSGLVLAVEIDCAPTSDDPALLSDLLAELRPLPVLLLAYSHSAPSSLSAEITVLRLGMRSTTDLVESVFVPGPGSAAIKRRLAIDSDGSLNLFLERFIDAIKAHGPRLFTGRLGALRKALVAPKLADRLDQLPPDSRRVLAWLAHVAWPVPWEFFEDEERRLVDGMIAYLHTDEKTVTILPEVISVAKRNGAPTRTACTEIVARLDSLGLLLAPLPMTALCIGAGLFDRALAMLKEGAREPGAARFSYKRMSALFDRLGAHANRRRDSGFWEVRGELAVAAEQYRDGAAFFERAMRLNSTRRCGLALKCGLAAEAAGDYRLAARVSEAALDGHTTQPTDDETILLLSLAARSRYRLGDSESADEHWKRASGRSMSSRVGALVRGIFQRDYGYYEYRRGRHEQARKLLESAEVAIGKIPAATRDLAQALHYRGLLEKEEGRFDLAASRLARASELYAEDRQLLKQALAASDLGVVHIEREAWAEARRQLEVSLDILRRLRNPRAITLAGYNLAEVMIATGEYEQARRLLERCLHADQASGNERSRGYDLSALGVLNLYRGAWDEAEALLEEALAIFASEGDCSETIDALLKLLRLHITSRDLARAGKCIERIDVAGLGAADGANRLRAENAILRARFQMMSSTDACVVEKMRSLLREENLRPSHRAEAQMVLAEALAASGAEAGSFVAAYEQALHWGNLAGNPHLQSEIRLSMLEHSTDAALRLPGFIEKLEEILERSDHRGIIRLYRAWSEANRGRLGLAPSSRFVPPEVESDVYRITRAAGRSSSDEAVAGLVMDAIVERVGADCGVLVLREKAGALTVAAQHGRSGQLDGPIETFVRRAIESARGVFLDGEDTGSDGNMRACGLAGVIVVPLIQRGAAAGAIYLDRSIASGSFKADDVAFATALAEGLAIGLRADRARSSLQVERDRHPALANVITVSERMRPVLELAGRVAPRNVTVLLSGESGTGKEVLARAIHEMSDRGDGERFVSVNCGAIPESLIESELFGCRRGAFTDAREDRAGLVEAADGGTLLLDEIGELPLRLQPKLLRFLQEREFRRLGESRTRKADVRVIAATNKDLASEVESGRFRSDLLYRLQVVSIVLPPLRERPEDIVPLAEHFLRACAALHGMGVPRLGNSARAWLARRRWPGNIRELQNAVQRALLLNGDAQVLELEHFSGDGAGETLVQECAGAPFATACMRFERELLIENLKRAGGNRSECARTLGLSRQGLLKLIKKHGIENEVPRRA